MSRPLFIGLERLRPERTNSTNSWLRDHLLQHPGAVEGLVVVTPQQTAGRGQQGRVWISAPGENLTASVLLRPRFLAPNALFFLNKAIALAVRDTLADYVPEVCIKWPNDIYAGEKKLAGILIETSVNTQVQWVIAGVGINVNQTEFGPDAPLAGSLAQITGRRYAVEDILDALCRHLEHRYLQLRSGAHTKLDAEYHSHLRFRGLHCRFQSAGHDRTGILKGVDDAGCLIMTEASGDHAYRVGEVDAMQIME